MCSVMFYDGECGFCNHWVGFYLRNRPDDLEQCIRISPLQGEAAKKLLPTKYIEDLNSFVLYREDGKIFRKSSAVIGVMNTMNGKYRLLAKFMWCVPRCIRNCFYDLVAANRNRFAKDFCYLPTKEEKSLFID